MGDGQVRFPGFPFCDPFFFPCFGSLITDNGNGTSGEGPVERFGKGVVEVVDEFKQSLFQLGCRPEIAATQNGRWRIPKIVST
jgi:hypothetical protein